VCVHACVLAVAVRQQVEQLVSHHNSRHCSYSFLLLVIIHMARVKSLVYTNSAYKYSD
jgi:hypothetical protein